MSVTRNRHGQHRGFVPLRGRVGASLNIGAITESLFFTGSDSTSVYVPFGMGDSDCSGHFKYRRSCLLSYRPSVFIS